MATIRGYHLICSDLCVSGYSVEIEQIALLFTNFATVKNIDWRKVWQQMHTQAYRLLWALGNLGRGNHNHNAIDHTQPIEITNE